MNGKSGVLKSVTQEDRNKERKSFNCQRNTIRAVEEQIIPVVARAKQHEKDNCCVVARTKQNEAEKKCC